MKARLIHSLLAAVLLCASSATVFAHGLPKSCAGTYLMAEDGGATSLWTLEADGTFFASSSLQPLLNFSDQQGSWTKDGSQGAKGVLLALVFDGGGALLNVSRVDI